MGKDDDKKKDDKKKDDKKKDDKKKDDKHKSDKKKDDKKKDDKKKDDKHKSDKDKKDKDKKDKEKKEKAPQDWKISVSKDLDTLISAYDRIVNHFRDMDNYILTEAADKDDFIERVKKSISDLPDATQQIFLAFLNAI